MGVAQPVRLWAGALLVAAALGYEARREPAPPRVAYVMPASPVVAVPTSEDAVLKFGTAENTQYFTRDADGRFSLKAVPVTPQGELHIELDREMAGDALAWRCGAAWPDPGRRVNDATARPGLQE